MAATARVISDDRIRCVECRYQLRGLTFDDRCPECGFEIYRTLQKLRGVDPADMAARFRWLGATFLSPLLLMASALGCGSALGLFAASAALMRVFLAVRLARPVTVPALGFPDGLPQRLRTLRVISYLESIGLFPLLMGWALLRGERIYEVWMVGSCYLWIILHAGVMIAGGSVATALADHWEYPLVRLEIRNQRLLLLAAVLLGVAASIALPAGYDIGSRTSLYFSFGTFASAASLAGLFTLSAYAHLAHELLHRLDAPPSDRTPPRPPTPDSR